MTPVGPSAPFFVKELRNQPFKPGGVAVLEARVVGDPTPSVEWLKDGEQLNNYRYGTLTLSTYSLHSRTEKFLLCQIWQIIFGRENDF